jgi:hypothetical protein
VDKITLWLGFSRSFPSLGVRILAFIFMVRNLMLFKPLNLDNCVVVRIIACLSLESFQHLLVPILLEYEDDAGAIYGHCHRIRMF